MKTGTEWPWKRKYYRIITQDVENINEKKESQLTDQLMIKAEFVES